MERGAKQPKTIRQSKELMMPTGTIRTDRFPVSMQQNVCSKHKVTPILQCFLMPMNVKCRFKLTNLNMGHVTKAMYMLLSDTCPSYEALSMII